MPPGACAFTLDQGVPWKERGGGRGYPLGIFAGVPHCRMWRPWPRRAASQRLPDWPRATAAVVIRPTNSAPARRGTPALLEQVEDMGRDSAQRDKAPDTAPPKRCITAAACPGPAARGAWVGPKRKRAECAPTPPKGQPDKTAAAPTNGSPPSPRIASFFGARREKGVRGCGGKGEEPAGGGAGVPHCYSWPQTSDPPGARR